MLRKTSLIVLFTLILIADSNTQVSFGISGGVNLEDSYLHNATDAINGLIQNEFDGMCSGVSSSAHQDLVLTGKSYSVDCPFSANANTTASWRNFDCQIIGNNSISVPIELIFEYTGKITLITTAGCFNSIAQSLYHSQLKYAVDNDTITQIKDRLQIQYNGGFLSLFLHTGVEESDVSINVIPNIIANDTVVYLGNEIGEIIELYNNLSIEEQNADSLMLSAEFIRHLSNPVSFSQLEAVFDTLSVYTDNFITLISYLGYDDILNLPEEYETGYMMDMNYAYTRKVSVELTDNQKMYLDVFLNTSAGTIPTCFSSSTTDFSNTVKLSKIYLSDGFDPSGLDLDSLKFVLNDETKIPITFNPINSTQEVFVKSIVRIFPNPSNSHINIESDIYITRIEFLDSFGKPIILIKEVNSNQYYQNLSEFPPGIIFVRVFTDKGIITKKLIR